MTNNIKPAQDSIRINEDTYIGPAEAQTAYPVAVMIHSSDTRDLETFTPRPKLFRVKSYNAKRDDFTAEVLEEKDVKNAEGRWVKKWTDLTPGVYHPTGFAHTNTKNYSNEKYILITPKLRVYELTRQQIIRYNQGDRLNVGSTAYYISKTQPDYIEDDIQLTLFDLDDFAA